MGTIASQITSLMIVYSIVYSDADQRKHQSSASLAFVRGIHRGPVNSPHKWPVTRKMFPYVIMFTLSSNIWLVHTSDITVSLSYAWNITVIHNVFTIYTHTDTHIYIYIYMRQWIEASLVQVEGLPIVRCQPKLWHIASWSCMQHTCLFRLIICGPNLQLLGNFLSQFAIHFITSSNWVMDK